MRQTTHNLTIIHRLSVCLFPGTTKTAEPIATIFWVCNPGTPWSKIGINIMKTRQAAGDGRSHEKGNFKLAMLEYHKVTEVCDLQKRKNPFEVFWRQSNKHTIWILFIAINVNKLLQLNPIFAVRNGCFSSWLHSNRGRIPFLRTDLMTVWHQIDDTSASWVHR